MKTAYISIHRIHATIILCTTIREKYILGSGRNRDKEAASKALATSSLLISMSMKDSSISIKNTEKGQSTT